MFLCCVRLLLVEIDPEQNLQSCPVSQSLKCHVCENSMYIPIGRNSILTSGLVPIISGGFLLCWVILLEDDGTMLNPFFAIIVV